MIPKTEKYLLFFLVILYILPLNIYMIGNNLGSGVQWAFFHYQQTIYGNQIFTLKNDFEYVYLGIVTGRSALSLLLWTSAALLMLIPTMIFLIADIKGKSDNQRLIGVFIIISGLLFLLSSITQYGPTLNGPAGFCIPIGIAAVWIIGYFVYKGVDKIEV